MVAVGHLGMRAWVMPHSFPGRFVQQDGGPIVPGYWFGWVGVEIFFVISGLVIANSAAAGTPMSFLRGRATRLYPVAWISVLIIAALAVLMGVRAPERAAIQAIGAATLIPGAPLIDPVFWTLGVEVVFYALVFGLAWLGRGDFLRLLAFGLGAASSLYIAGRHFDLFALPGILERLTLLRHGCFFALGIFFWMASKARLSRFEMAGAIVAGLAGAAEVYLKAGASAGSLEEQAQIGWLGAPVLVWGLAMAALFVVATRNPSLPFPKVLRTLGLATYPYYLLHQSVGGAVMRPLLDVGVAPMGALAAALIAVFLVCWGICSVLERPLAKALGQLIDWVEVRTLRKLPLAAGLYRPAAPSAAATAARRERPGGALPL